MDLSQACTSMCLVVNSRMVKLFPRQHVSALESVSLADSVPGLGWDAALAKDELEFMSRVDECTALIDGHSVHLPLFCAWELRPPTIDEGNPGGVGGVLFCWVSAETMLSESFG